MKNPIKSIRDFFHRVNERHRQKEEWRKTDRTLGRIAVVHETFNKFRQAGLLYYDFKRNIVTIAQPLAEQFFYDDDNWQHFLKELHLWAVYQFSIAEYTKQFNAAKANAEARAYAKNPKLTHTEKMQARMQAISDFDAHHDDHRLQIPDITFVVLGMGEEHKPIVVAQLKDGRYETGAVEDA